MSRTRARTTATSIATAALVLGTLGAVTPAQAAEGTPPQGLTSSSPDSTTTVLTWERDTAALRYVVQVDDDSSFRSPEYDVTTTGTTAVPHSALKAGLNHWRVRAVPESGTVSEWTNATFVRPDPAVPRLLAPADGTELAQPDEPPLLQWSEVSGAKSYTVEIDDAPDFIGAARITTATTSTVPSSPLALGTWFWRVSATDAGGQVSAPATPGHFVVRALPAPEPLSPASSPNEQVEDVVLDWKPVKGAATYELQVAVNNSFEAGDRRAEVRGITSTRWSPPDGLANDQYYWRVRAVDAAGSPSPWSRSLHAFERHWPDRPWPVSPVQPDFPAYPSDFDTSRPGHRSHPFYPTYVKNHDPDALGIARYDEPTPFIQWTPVQHASHYELELSRTKGFEPSTTTTCVVVGTTFTPTNVDFATGRLRHRCPVKEGDVHYWRVRAMDLPHRVQSEYIRGIYSPIQKFVWEPRWFTSVSPAPGATIQTPRFSWASAVGTAEYTVTVRDKAGSVVARGSTRATSWTPAQKLDPADSPFAWTLSGTTADGGQSLLHSRQFSLATGGTGGAESRPALTALTGTEDDAPTTRAPELSWVPHPDAAYYRVAFGHADVPAWLTPERDETFGKNLHYPRMTDSGIRAMTPGRYKWRVEAYGEKDQLLQTSGTNVFRIADFAPVTGLRIGLDGSALANGRGCAAPLDVVNNASTCPEVPTTPVLTWDPQKDATYYGVYVSYDQHFTTPTERNIPASTGTMYAYDTLTLPDNTSGVPYYWYVRPCRAVGVCGPDPASAATGLSMNAFKKVSPQVETEPTADVVADEVTFTWKDYHETNQAHRVTRDGAPSWSAVHHRAPLPGAAINASDLSNQSAARYRIRVATDETFTTVIDDRLVEQTTYTAFAKLYPEGPLFWKVSAIDHSGHELSSSTPRRFTKSSAAAVTRSPAPHSLVAGTVPFRWEADAFAGQYELEVSRGDDKFSAANRVFSTRVWTTAYTWNKPLPVSETPYYWRVRRIDSSRNATTWSQPVPFRVVSEPVSLTSPAGGSTQVPNGPHLVWKPLARAATYLVEVRDATGKVVESQSTPATSYALTKPLAHGSYRWYVTARDNDGKALTAPSNSSFHVDSAITEQDVPAIGHDTERPQVGSVLSIAPVAWDRAGVSESHQWLRDGSAIRGATERTYTTTTADFGKAIAVRITGSLPTYDPRTVVSSPVSIGAGGVVMASAAPEISGTAAVGQRLTTTTGSWPRGTKLAYQWLRNGAPIPGATAKTYTLTVQDAMKRVSARVTGSLTGLSDGTATSQARSVPKARSATSASLSATKVKRGKKVTVRIKVVVPSLAAPTGKVVVQRGKKKVKTLKLRVSHKGSITFVLPKKKFRKKGRHRIVVRYQGTGTIAGSKSRPVVLRVT